MSVEISALASTWNNAGTTFYGIFKNITNTASAAGSRILALQVGGSNKIDVDVSGNQVLAGSLTATRSILATGTITSSTPVINGTQTWNAVGTAFDADLIDVTNTASASTSTLIHRKVGGSTVFKVDKTANATLATAANQYCTLTLQGSDRGGTIAAAGNGLEITSSSGLYCQRLAIGSAWSTNMDVILIRDAANVLAQRNSTNAQTSRVYTTYTNTSNYERLALNTAAGSVELAAESAGTGSANIDVKLTPKGTGVVQFGSHSAIAAETVTGYITIKDSGGTSRKVAVVS